MTLLRLTAGRVALMIGIVTFPAGVLFAATVVDAFAAAVAFGVKFGIWLLLILRIVLFMVALAVTFGVALPLGGVVVHPATQNIPTAARQTRQRIMRFLGDIALHPVPVVRGGHPFKNCSDEAFMYYHLVVPRHYNRIGAGLYHDDGRSYAGVLPRHVFTMFLFAIGGGVASPFGVGGLEIRLDLGPEQVRAPDAELPPDRLDAEGPA